MLNEYGLSPNIFLVHIITFLQSKNWIYNNWYTYRLESNEMLGDENYIRMLDADLNKSRKQDPTKTAVLCPFTSHLTNHPRKISKIIDVLQWTPIHGHTSVGYPAKAYIHQVCVDSRCHLEHLPVVDRGKRQEN